MNAKTHISNTQIKEIDESISQLETGREKCPVCDSDLNEQKISELIQQKQSNRISLERAINELNEKLTEVYEQRKRYQNELEKTQKAIEEKKWIDETRKKILEENITLEKNLKENGQKLAEFAGIRDLNEITKELSKVKEQLSHVLVATEIVSCNQLLEIANGKLEELNYDERVEREIYEELKETDKKIAVENQEVAGLREIISEKKARLEELTKLADTIKKNKEEAEYLGGVVESFQILQKVLQDVQVKLREEFTNTTNIALSDVWQKIYPYKDYQNLRLSVDEGGDYVLQLKRRDGKWASVEGVTSGGERSTACLALRIALSLVLTQNLSWLILDEPTHNLDKQAIRELAVTLREHLPQIVDQVFIITHEEELESAASGYLYKLERRKEEDEPTRVVLEKA